MECEHNTTIVIFDNGVYKIEKCTWGCGEALVSMDDGNMTYTVTISDLFERIIELEG